MKMFYDRPTSMRKSKAGKKEEEYNFSWSPRLNQIMVEYEVSPQIVLL